MYPSILIKFLTVGMSVTTVQLIGWYINHISKKCNTALVIYSPTTDHDFFKEYKI